MVYTTVTANPAQPILYFVINKRVANRLLKGGDVVKLKRFTNSSKDVALFKKIGYKVVAMCYFTENKAISFSLEKVL